MSTAILDLEHLQQINYERSKTWATFLENVAKSETLKEIDISELEKVYGPEFEENDSNEELASMEDSECDENSIDSDILRNVTNTTRFSLFFNNKTLALPEAMENDENHELVDLFNQTLPIINEHNRHLRESGFEKILNSFDKKKIEEKVGSWLNRHNSLYGGDASLLYAEHKDKSCAKFSYSDNKDIQSSSALCKKNKSYKISQSGNNECNDSDDSFQSGETARYIRSSRVGALKNSSSSTTMIKTYRLVKSTREALREKYAFDKDDDECHLKAVRHRRRNINNLEYHHNHDLVRTQRSHKRQICTTPSLNQRRRVLRKRVVSNSCSTLETSDSDYYYENDDHLHRQRLPSCCTQHRCKSGYNKCQATAVPHSTTKRSQRRTARICSTRLNRMYYYSRSFSKSLSSSSSSTSFSDTYESRRLLKMKCKFYNDKKLCKRESECHCCNDRKLCQEYKQATDTSAKEWHVEDCYSPKKTKTPSTKSNSHKRMTAVDEPGSSESEEVNTIQRKRKPSKTKCTEVQTNQNEIEKFEKNKQKPKTVKNKKDSKVSSTLFDESFNRELELAIKASKELYEKEQQKKTNNAVFGTKGKSEKMPTKPLRKIVKGSNNEKGTSEQAKSNCKRQTTNKDCFSSEDEVNEKIPKPNRKRQTTNKDCFSSEDEVNEKIPKLFESNIVNLEKDIDDSVVFCKPKQTFNKKSTKIFNNSSTTKTDEDTFIATSNAHPKTIYNSTAMSTNSKAYNRQFADKIRQQNGLQEQEIVEVEDKTRSPVKKSKTTKIQTKKSKITKINETCSTTLMNCTPININAASSAVTSTTIRSPDKHSTATSNGIQIKSEIDLNHTLEELSDCTLVTSTTTTELPNPTGTKSQIEETQPPMFSTEQQLDKTLTTNLQQTRKGILIYTPQNRSLAPAHSFSNDGYFTITKEHLSRVIGEKPAEKFLKYYIGRRRFNSNSTIYFRPPSMRTLDSNNASSTSDSDDDLDSLGQYGDLYESLNKATDCNTHS